LKNKEQKQKHIANHTFKILKQELFIDY